MNKLISANFFRLVKDKVFIYCSFTTLFIGILTTVVRYNSDKKMGTIFTLEGSFVFCSIVLAMLLAVFCSLFIGTEFNDGTIRNKIIAGHSRTTIYFSYLFINVVAVFILCTIYFAVSFSLGALVGGTFQIEFKLVMALILNLCILTIAYSSIFTMISTLNQNRASVSIICIFCTLALFLAGSFMYTRLNEPEMNPAYTSVNGSPVSNVDTPNPAYLDGTAREIYTFLYDFLPGGQTVQYASSQITNFYTLALYSSVIVIITTAIGVVFFLKKDLR